MPLWGVDPDETLAHIRAMRADPPALARRGKRRQVFGSALEQFDELLLASRHVGPATSPITLFYSLSQAGRAIAAAHYPDRGWEAHGHGLGIKISSHALGEVVIEPSGQGDSDLFSIVSTAVGSPRLRAPTTLSAAWAAVPNLWLRPELGHGEAVAVLVERDSPSAEWSGRIWGPLAGDLPDGPDATHILRQRLRPYPGADDVQVLRVLPRGALRPEEPGVFVSWPATGGDRRDLADVAPPFIAGGAHFLRPGLGSSHDAVSPLMAWWLVLLTLSSVARYEPALWRKALEPDASPVAVPIERALALWRELGPAALLYALRGTSPS